MVSLKNGNPMRVPAAGMSDIGRTGGGRVLAQCTGLLMDAGGWRALESWSGVICWGIHPWLFNSSECFTHRVFWTCDWIGSDGEKPRKKPHWISLTHLGEDLLECGVHLLSHPGPLVLMIPGQPFLFKGQLPPQLSLSHSTHLQLPQGHVEAECLLGLWAYISMGVEEGSRDWQWYKGGQWWSSPELSHRASLRNRMTL